MFEYLPSKEEIERYDAFYSFDLKKVRGVCIMLAPANLGRVQTILLQRFPR